MVPGSADGVSARDGGDCFAPDGRSIAKPAQDEGARGRIDAASDDSESVGADSRLRLMQITVFSLTESGYSDTRGLMTSRRHYLRASGAATARDWQAANAICASSQRQRADRTAGVLLDSRCRPVAELLRWFAPDLPEPETSAARRAFSPIMWLLRWSSMILIPTRQNIDRLLANGITSTILWRRPGIEPPL